MPLFSAKKACAGPLENCGFPGSAHAFLFSAFSLLQSALHLLQDLRDLCTGIAIPAQRTADAGIVFALTAHQHRHVGHRHVPRSVAAQTGGTACAAPNNENPNLFSIGEGFGLFILF